MTRCNAKIVAIALMVPSAPALCQDGWTGTRLPGDRPGNVASAGTPPAITARSVTARAEQGSEIAHDTAICLASRKPQLSEAVVLAPDEKARLSAIKTLMPSLETCLVTGGAKSAHEMRFQSSILAGVLAEALLRKAGRPKLSALPPRHDYAAKWTSDEAGKKTVEEMAVCLSERQPEQVAELLWSDPGTSRELSAMAAIQPAIGPCLTAKATLKTNRLGLRVALARAYFYRTFTPQVAATAPR